MASVSVFVTSAQGFTEYLLQNNTVVMMNSWFLSFSYDNPIIQSCTSSPKTAWKDDKRKRKQRLHFSLCSLECIHPPPRLWQVKDDYPPRHRVNKWTRWCYKQPTNWSVKLYYKQRSSTNLFLSSALSLAPSPSLAVSLQTPRQHSSLSTHLIKPFVKLRCKAEQH